LISILANSLALPDGATDENLWLLGA